jgi:hypothetical protein
MQFVGRYFHSRALETSKAHRLRVPSGEAPQNIVPFDELKAEIVALLAIRSTWNQYTLQTYCIAFELVPPATRKELIDEIQV